MNSKKPDARPVELELVAMDPPAGEPSRDDGAPAQPAKSLGITSADPFLEEAAREYQSGKVDKALWARAMAVKGGDDESIAVAAYLRARATTLEAERRNARAAARAEGPATGSPTSRMGGPTTGTRAGREGPPSAMRGTSTEGPRTRSRDSAPPSPPRSAGRRPAVPRNVMWLGAAAAGFSFVAVLLWVLAAPHQTESARQALNNAVRNAPAARPASTAAVATVTAAPAVNEPTLADKVQEMKRAGNWNVLVLNATEWTRKEPANALAWRELGQGYAKLRQFDEALDAATRATTLAPSDPDAWTGLGRVNVSLERWRDAGFAFDKALAVRADDADALCGAMVVARRELRPKDADALARRIADDAACKAYGDSQSVAVVPRTKSAQN